MADLSTKYMGFELKNPLIVGSSELTDSAKKVKTIEEQGAGAVVLKSLFEEQIMMEVDAQRVNNMYGSYGDVENYVSFYTKKHNLEEYLQLIKDAKSAVDIPVIASINCISASEWVDFATQIESAGADGIELNMFIMPNDPKFDGRAIEQIYFDVAYAIQDKVSIPISLKMSSYFSGLAHSFLNLANTRIKAMVLFNRFYSPDIDLDKEELVARHVFSSPDAITHSLRWIGMLSDQINCDLAASNGVHDGFGVIKNLLVGAKATQVVSTLYKNKVGYLQTMQEQLNYWLDNKGYAAVADIIGKLSLKQLDDPMMYERAQFMKYFSNYSDAKY